MLPAPIKGGRSMFTRKALGDQTPAALLFAGPALLGLTLFIAAPFLLAVVLAFTNLRLGSPLPLEFVGLKQFARIFSDPGFQRALFNNLVFAVVVVPLQTGIALGLALSRRSASTRSKTCGGSRTSGLTTRAAAGTKRSSTRRTR